MHNKEGVFILIEYELIYFFIASLSAVIGTCALGKKSTWEIIYIPEYFSALVILIFPYWIGLYCIIKYKFVKQYQLKKIYWENIVIGGILYSLLAILKYCEFSGDKNIEVAVILWVFVILFFVLQIISNISLEQTKDIQYKIFTEKDVYISEFKPIKYKDFYYIKLMSENMHYEESVLIPEQRIIKMIVEIRNCKQANAFIQHHQGEKSNLNED